MLAHRVASSYGSWVCMYFVIFQCIDVNENKLSVVVNVYADD